MRKSHICPKCEHGTVLLIDTVADSTGGQTHGSHIAATPTGSEYWFGGGPRFAAAGKLSAVVCKRCGYTEMYVEDPATIPVDGKFVREVSAPAGDTPFR